MSTSIDIEELKENDAPDVNEPEKEVKAKGFQWFFERQFDKYFEFVKAKSEKSVLVRCLDCPAKTLTVTANSAYNLNIHVEVISLQHFKAFQFLTFSLLVYPQIKTSTI